MNDVIQFFLYCMSGIVLNAFCLYFWNNLVDKKINWKSLKTWLIIIAMDVVCVLLNMYCQQPIRFLLSFIFLTIFCFIITRQKFSVTLCLMLLLDLNMFFSEMIFSFVINFIVSDYNTKLIISFSNIFVAFIGYCFLKTKIPNKTFVSLNELIILMKNKEIILYSLMVIMVIITSILESYMKVPLSLVVITNTLMAFIFIIIITRFVSAKTNYQKISNKYQTSISSLKEHEYLLDKFRINSHENKNELLTIRNMSSEKEVISYIDKLVDNKIKDNESIVNKTSKIPKGGLRATIYSKMCVMDKNRIDCKLNISKEVKTVDLINMDESLVVNVCRILGVFLDNSIEEVNNLDKKCIKIDLYLVDDDLFIDITNQYEGYINLANISKSNYTSKGKDHGYGLALVDQIIKESDGKIINEKSIEGNLFTQTLIITSNAMKTK